ncbi:Cytochrome P450 [Sergentomyia squamirostris]
MFAPRRTTHFSWKQLRCFSAQVSQMVASDLAYDDHNIKWKDAKPYKSIPGPTTISLIRGFMPGGKFYDGDLSKMHKMLRDEYGDIYRIKGSFGKRDTVVVHDPQDFETLYRTSGNFPVRRGLYVLTYYRQHYSKLHVNSLGLGHEQGASWWDLRHKVNGVMMKPQVVKGYTSAVDDVSMDFVRKLHTLRDKNQETPANFYYHLNIWALEAIAYITMNMRLGLLQDKSNPNADKLAENIKDFFRLGAELDFQPSIWKIYKTPKFNQYIQTMDSMQDIVRQFIDQGLESLKTKTNQDENVHGEKGVLEKLYDIDRDVAVIMAVDSLIAGVHTTSTAVFSILYTLATNFDKQKILRSELLKILPKKDSPLTKENMTNMPYLRACIKEAMRLMPVVVGNSRAIAKDIVIKGYQIPKDIDVLMHHQALHTDERYFQNPQAFIPERWLRSEEKIETYNPFTYLPFGFGNRVCIGRRFAELEIETLVCRLVRNYQLEWHHPPPKVQFSTINMPKGNLQLRLRDYQ